MPFFDGRPANGMDFVVAPVLRGDVDGLSVDLAFCREGDAATMGTAETGRGFVVLGPSRFGVLPSRAFAFSSGA